MSISDLLQNITDLYYDYPILVIAVGIVILIWAYKKPKQASKGFLFLCFVALVFYVLSLMGEGTGSSINMKDQMMRKTEKAEKALE